VATVGVKGLMLSNVLRYYILMHLHCLRTEHQQSWVNVDSVTQLELLAVIEVVLAFMLFISLSI